MTNKIIKQDLYETTSIGGSQYMRLPAGWLQDLQGNETTKLRIRLCENKIKQKFIDLFKPEE